MNNVRDSLSGPLGISLAGIVIGAGVVLLTGPGVLGAIFSPSSRDIAGEKEKAESLALHTDSVKGFQGRVEGRSPFFVPLPPPTTIVKAPVLKKPDETTIIKDDTPPPPPPDYTGPALVGILGEHAFFAGSPDFVVDIGAETQGVKVLDIAGPWTVKVAHKGGEYDVHLLDPELLEGFTKMPFDGYNLPASSKTYTPSSSSSDASEEAAAPKHPAAAGRGKTPPGKNGARGTPSVPKDEEVPPAPPSRGRGKDGDDPNGSEEQSTIPEPYTKEKIDGMSKSEALEALGEVTKARKNTTLDQETKDRLKTEFDMLMEKVRKGG
jgi:hypothetical protein